MPLLFPSHPGLMAPLWCRWPGAFTPLAASVGAMAPDLVDGIVGLQRGHLGQAYGHSLFGLSPDLRLRVPRELPLALPVVYPSWFEMPVPFYESPYPVGPHFMVWIFLSILGGVLLFAHVGGRSGLREDPAPRGT